MAIRKAFSRFDVQVAVFVTIAVLATTVAVSLIIYRITYQSALASLRERCDAIEQTVASRIDADAFDEMADSQAQQTEAYQDLNAYLNSVREAAGVEYLYTATKDGSGRYVYAVDGLSQNADDFARPGSAVEAEIYPELDRAFSGETVYPGDIKATTWGQIFIAYYPIWSGDKVVGVLGIEIDAESMYQSYRWLFEVLPFIIIAICAIAWAVSLAVFKRISNPSYHDLSNTDLLTGFKSRNAFEVDMANRAATAHDRSCGLVILDLNGLKLVNDTLGHSVGDEYIQHAADAMRAALDVDEGSLENLAIYRIGGDEFVAMAGGVTEEMLEGYAGRISDELASQAKVFGEGTSCSSGWAVFDKSADASLEDAFRRADKMMYENKKAYYSGHGARRPDNTGRYHEEDQKASG